MKREDERLATQRLLEVIRGREIVGVAEDPGDAFDAGASRSHAQVPARGGPVVTPALRTRSLLHGRVRVGLDIGHHTVKMVQVERTTRGFRLLQLGMAETNPRGDTPEALLEGQVEAARPLLRDVQPRRDLVVTSLSDSGIIIRQTTLPRMPTKDLAQAIPFEARKHMPYDPARVLLRYQVLSEDRKGATCQVLLAAVPQEVYEHHLSLLERLGIEPYAIEVSPLALANAYLLAVSKPQDTVVIVDMGATRTVIDIERAGGMFFCRHLPISGDGFTREIQRTLGLSFERAEQVKRGENLAGDPDMREVLDSVRPAMNGLLMELRRSLAYYDNATGRNGFSRVILSGGGALLPGLCEFLEENLGLPVEPMNPLAGMQWELGDFDHGWVKRTLPVWAQAIGLATRR